MDAGAYDDLWVEFENNFDGHIDEIKQARANNICIGSDQEWMRIYLGKDRGIPRWTEEDGVYEFNQVRRWGLQSNAAMVFFAGARDPSTTQLDWVTENWRV